MSNQKMHVLFDFVVDDEVYHQPFSTNRPTN